MNLRERVASELEAQWPGLTQESCMAAADAVLAAVRAHITAGLDEAKDYARSQPGSAVGRIFTDNVLTALGLLPSAEPEPVIREDEPR